MAKKRLVVCCDGTWNTPDEVRDGKPCQTNVTKIARAVVTPQDTQGIEQRVYYHKGVGTSTFDHFSGGALGRGLSRNVQDAYMFLVENYDDPFSPATAPFKRLRLQPRCVHGAQRRRPAPERGPPEAGVRRKARRGLRALSRPHRRDASAVRRGGTLSQELLA